MRPKLAGKSGSKNQVVKCELLNYRLIMSQFRQKEDECVALNEQLKAVKNENFSKVSLCFAKIKSAFSFNAMSVDTIHENVIIKIYFKGTSIGN